MCAIVGPEKVLPEGQGRDYAASFQPASWPQLQRLLREPEQLREQLVSVLDIDGFVRRSATGSDDTSPLRVSLSAERVQWLSTFSNAQWLVDQRESLQHLQQLADFGEGRYATPAGKTFPRHAGLAAAAAISVGRWSSAVHSIYEYYNALRTARG